MYSEKSQLDKNKLNQDNLELVVNLIKSNVSGNILVDILESEIYTQHLKNINNNVFEFSKKVDKFVEKKQISESHVQPQKSFTIKKNSKIISSIPIKISNNTGIQFQNNENNVKYFLGSLQYFIVSEIKYQDAFIEGILFSLSSLFRAIPFSEKKKYISDFKKKIAYEMEEQQYYKKFNYGKLRIKKSDITGSLLNDTIINLSSKKYIIDYFNINLLVISDKNTYFYYKYHEEKKTVVLHQNKKGMYPIMDIQNDTIILDNNQIQEMVKKGSLVLKFLKELKYTSLKKIKDYKLKELQEICIRFSIPIKKPGKKKEINRKKGELYDDIEKHDLLN